MKETVYKNIGCIGISVTVPNVSKEGRTQKFNRMFKVHDKSMIEEKDMNMKGDRVQGSNDDRI